MAKEIHIKPESSSEDNDEMETEEEEEEDDSSSSGQEVDQVKEPIKLNLGKNVQSASTDSDSGSETETGTVTVKDKEKKIDGEWFVKSGLARSVSGPAGIVNEEYMKRKWSKVPMKKKMEIADEYQKVENEEFGFVTRKAQLVYEVMSAISEAITSKKK